MSIIDQLGGTISESPKVSIRPMHKFAKSITETNSKVYKPSTYDEIINNLVHGSR